MLLKKTDYLIPLTAQKLNVNNEIVAKVVASQFSSFESFYTAPFSYTYFTFPGIGKVYIDHRSLYVHMKAALKFARSLPPHKRTYHIQQLKHALKAYSMGRLREKRIKNRTQYLLCKADSELINSFKTRNRFPEWPSWYKPIRFK